MEKNNTEYLTVSELRNARNQHSFYMIRNTTKTNSIKQREVICIKLLIYIIQLLTSMR